MKWKAALTVLSLELIITSAIALFAIFDTYPWLAVLAMVGNLIVSVGITYLIFHRYHTTKPIVYATFLLAIAAIPGRIVDIIDGDYDVAVVLVIVVLLSWLWGGINER